MLQFLVAPNTQVIQYVDQMEVYCACVWMYLVNLCELEQWHARWEVGQAKCSVLVCAAISVWMSWYNSENNIQQN